MPKLSITPVANSLINDIFPQVTPLLMKGKEFWEDYYRLIDIKNELIKGRLQLWVGIDENTNTINLMALTSIENYAISRWLRIIYMGGERLKDAFHYQREMEEWARKYGCRGTEVITRDGMERWLKPLGFKKRANWLVRKYNDG